MENSGLSVFITGGTGQLGRIFVAYFLHKGYRVTFTSQHEGNIKNIYEEFEPFAKKKMLHGLAVNLMDKQAIVDIINFFDRENLHPHCLVNNARNCDFLEIADNGMPTRENWLNEYHLDVVVPYELSMQLSRQPLVVLKNIVNISSIYGVVAPNPSLYDNPEQDSPVQYSVAKAALIHLTKELAVRLAPRHIRVNTVSYGGLEGRVPDDFKMRYGKLCPAGRMLTEKDIAGPLEFLCSDMSSGVTGHNVVVDGGLSIW